ASTINAFPVCNFHYIDDELVVLNRIDDTVWSLPDSVAVLGVTATAPELRSQQALQCLQR
ncbi:MAG: hypothetical protein OEU33_07330, partial [Chromatiales bacterium]|nr:hypothetical protein [Chromatiales bacterium]